MVLETPPVASGQRIDSGNLANAPQLNFKVNVSNPGDYTVWVRGMAPDPSGDSLHISVDGSPVGELSGFTMQEWTWAKLDMSGGDVTANLSGLHDLDLHMREDGLRVDKVVLTNPSTGSGQAPSGLGPTESSTAQVADPSRTTIQYTYDDLYRLTDAVYTGDVVASYEYAYDEVGNMQAYTETVDAVVTPHTRVFNAINQMVSETQTNVGTKSISYDTNGNMVRIDPVAGSGAPVKLYTFNQRNLMVKAEELGSSLQTVAEFRYDGNNDRLEQIAFTNGTASNTIQYTNDTIGLTQMLVSNSGAGNVVYHLYGNTLLGQQIDGSSQFQTFITDGLGSVRVEMETSGATNYVRTFSPFGETLEETGTSSSVYGYTGQQEDESTGLIYLRARYYSAELKAFTAYDLWNGVNRRPQSMNHYVYAEDNPINNIDPSGFCVGSTVDQSIDPECWKYLLGEFCQDLECKNTGWTNWFVLKETNRFPNRPEFSFNHPWTKTRLKKFAQDTQLVLDALRKIGIDWQSTPIGDARVEMMSDFDQRSAHYDHLPQIMRIAPRHLFDEFHNELTIPHEFGHALENSLGVGVRASLAYLFGAYSPGELALQFEDLTNIPNSDGTTAAEGCYFRQYGYDYIGNGYQDPLTRKRETWADAFAVFVYMNNNNGNYPDWHISKNDGNFQYLSPPDYDKINLNVQKILLENY